MEHMDISSAYLYAEMEEEVYCEIPTTPDMAATKNPKVWLLKKSLYGLHQSGRNFNKFLTKVLAKMGLKPVPADPGTFIVRDAREGGCASQHTLTTSSPATTRRDTTSETNWPNY